MGGKKEREYGAWARPRCSSLIEPVCCSAGSLLCGASALPANRLRCAALLHSFELSCDSALQPSCHSLSTPQAYPIASLERCFPQHTSPCPPGYSALLDAELS